MPRPRLYGLLLEFRAEGGVVHQARPVQACRATLVAKTAQVVALVLPYIAISRNVETIRPTPAVVAILKSVNKRTGAHLEMVVHDVAAKLAAVVAKAVRKAARDRGQQNERRSECRCTQEDHARKVFCLRTGFGMEYAHAARPIPLLVMDQLVHNRVRTQRHV